MTKIDLFDEALKKWGPEIQINMAIEECSELILAISKYKRYKHIGGYVEKGHIDNISEEVADVEIMLEQLKNIFKFSTLVTRIKTSKLKRLNYRLKKDEVGLSKRL